MTKITIYRDEQGYIVGYVSRGHTNYDDYGKDIVCAAISILTQSTLISLVKVCDIEEDKISYSIKEGYLDMELLDGIDKKKFQDAQIILRSLIVGLESIIDSYPEYVTLQYREV